MAEDAVDQGASGDEPVREWEFSEDDVSDAAADEASPDEEATDAVDRSGERTDQSATTDADATDTDTTDDDTYGGLFGAFPYAVRSSESLLFKSYVVLGGLAAALVAVLFGLALVVLLGNTVGADGGTFSFVRAFFIFVGLLVVAPLVAPVLFVARRLRRGRSTPTFELAMAGLGYTFMLSLYVAGIISTPAAQQQSVTGVASPVVTALYSLPRLAGLVPPLLVAAAMVVVARRWR